MSDVFISHVEENRSLVEELAYGLEAAGYTTWYYERDSLPGLSYLLQTSQAIEQAQVVVLVISRESLGSIQMTSEVVQAYEAGKPFIPVLWDITHTEFQYRQPEWRRAVGSATSLPVPPEGVSAIIPRIVGGLQRLRVELQRAPGTVSPPVSVPLRGLTPTPVARPTQGIAHYWHEQLAVYVAVLKNPLAVVSTIDLTSFESITAALRFFFFAYLLTSFVRIPLFPILYKVNLVNPLIFITVFVMNVVSFVIFLFMMHVAAKLMRGHGTLQQTLITSCYLIAFWPFLQIPLYIFIANPQTVDAFATGKRMTIFLLTDYMALTLIIIFFIYFIMKAVPSMSYIHNVGIFRAGIIATLGFSLTLYFWQFLNIVYLHFAKLHQ
jgi:TIR domain-containing protein